MADYLAILPGFFMCLMLLLMLVMDITIPEMFDKQYEDFENIFALFNSLVIVCGIIFIVIDVRKNKGLKSDIKSFVPFLLFAACIIISTCVNGITEEAIHGVSYRNIGVIHMLAFMIVYMGVSSRISRESFCRNFITGFLGLSILVAAAAIYDRYITPIPAFQAKKELSAIFFNGNHYGYFMVMAIMTGVGCFIFAKTKMALFGAAAAIVNSFVLILNHSLGCILAVIVSIIIACVILGLRFKECRRRILYLIIGATIVLIAAIVFSTGVRQEILKLIADINAVVGGNAPGSTGHNRLKVWRLALEYIGEKPLLGHGCEGISMRMYSETAISNPHNEFLTYAAYYGIPAMIFYISGIFTTLIHGFSLDYNSYPGAIACLAVLGYAISSIFGVAMFYTTPFFFIFLGLSIKSYN